MLVFVGLVLGLVAIVVEGFAGLDSKESNELDGVMIVSLVLIFAGFISIAILGI